MQIPDERDLRLEQGRIRRSAAAAFVVGGTLMVAFYFFMPRVIKHLPSDFEGLLHLWAVSSLFVVFWVIAGVGMVARGRRHSAADINGAAFAPPSPKIAVPVAFLQNTLEQALIAVFVNLALLLTVRDVAVPLVLGAVVLFSIGRITFFLGYGKGAGARAFGMVLTALPSLLFFVWILTALTLGAIF